MKSSSAADDVVRMAAQCRGHLVHLAEPLSADGAERRVNFVESARNSLRHLIAARRGDGEVGRLVLQYPLGATGEFVELTADLRTSAG